MKGAPHSENTEEVTWRRKKRNICRNNYKTRIIKTSTDEETIGTMSSVSVPDNSGSQDGLSDLGSDHRSAKEKRPGPTYSVVTHEVSELLLHKTVIIFFQRPLCCCCSVLTLGVTLSC